jgi:Protein of unknown function (DUF1328)
MVFEFTRHGVVPNKHVNLKIDPTTLPSKPKPARASNLQTVTLCRKGVDYGQSSLLGRGVLVIALVAAVLGFGGVAGVAMEGARLLF